MAEFSDIISDWVLATEKSMDLIFQSIVMKIGNSVVTLSPVDTGRFKGNWQLTIDQVATSSLLRYDGAGDVTLADIASKVKTLTIGQIAYVQNTVLYGHDLEYGSSKQAPDGMVRITAALFSRIVDDAVRLNTQ